MVWSGDIRRRVRPPDKDMVAAADVGPGGRPDVGHSARGEGVGHGSRW